MTSPRSPAPVIYCLSVRRTKEVIDPPAGVSAPGASTCTTTRSNGRCLRRRGGRCREAGVEKVLEPCRSRPLKPCLIRHWPSGWPGHPRCERRSCSPQTRTGFSRPASSCDGAGPGHCFSRSFSRERSHGVRRMVVTGKKWSYSAVITRPSARGSPYESLCRSYSSENLGGE